MLEPRDVFYCTEGEGVISCGRRKVIYVTSSDIDKRDIYTLVEDG